MKRTAPVLGLGRFASTSRSERCASDDAAQLWRILSSARVTMACTRPASAPGFGGCSVVTGSLRVSREYPRHRAWRPNHSASVIDQGRDLLPRHGDDPWPDRKPPGRATDDDAGAGVRVLREKRPQVPRIGRGRRSAPLHFHRHQGPIAFDDPVDLGSVRVSPEPKVQSAAGLPDGAKQFEADVLLEQRAEFARGRACPLLGGCPADAEIEEEVAGRLRQLLARAARTQRVDALGDQAVLQDLVVAGDGGVCDAKFLCNSTDVPRRRAC